MGGGLGYHHGLSRVPIGKLAFKDVGLIWIHQFVATGKVRWTVPCLIIAPLNGH